MGLSPILSIIHTLTIGTMLNFNGCNNGHGLENVSCKQTVNRLPADIIDAIDIIPWWFYKKLCRNIYGFFFDSHLYRIMLLINSYIQQH